MGSGCYFAFSETVASVNILLISPSVKGQINGREKEGKEMSEIEIVTVDTVTDG